MRVTVGRECEGLELQLEIRRGRESLPLTLPLSRLVPSLKIRFALPTPSYPSYLQLKGVRKGVGTCPLPTLTLTLTQTLTLTLTLSPKMRSRPVPLSLPLFLSLSRAEARSYPFPNMLTAGERQGESYLPSPKMRSRPVPAVSSMLGRKRLSRGP